MASFLQLIVGGLAAGSIYALTALGLILIFKTTDVVNFANGEMAMVGAFACYALLSRAHVPYPLAFLGAMVFAAALGMGVERVLMRPLQQAPVLSQIILTLGLLLVFQGLVGTEFGYDPLPFPKAWAGQPFRLSGIAISREAIVQFAVAVVLMLGLFAFFRYSRFGLAMRATAQNIGAARLMGIPVGRVFNWTWGVGTMLGCVAGILVAPTTAIDPTFMSEVAIKAFAAAVIGGFTSLPGAVLGGLLLGVLENLVSLVSLELKTVFAFAVILVMLIVRPQGLLGVSIRKKV